jgi:hypothetical protein
VLLGGFILAVPVRAAYVDVSAGTNWYSIDTVSTYGTVNAGNQAIASMWISGTVIPGQGAPATANRGNALTPTLNASHMMWACGSFGELCTVVDDNVLAPTQAFFALPFTLDRKNASGRFSIVADDYVELWIDGHFVFNALLEQNQADMPGFPAPQPAPLVVDIDHGDISVTGNTLNLGLDLNDLIQPGVNVLTIMAMNGALLGTGVDCSSPTQHVIVLTTNELFCAYERLNEYLYVVGAIQDANVPEPSGLAVLALGLAGLAATRRRKQ